MLEKSTAEGEDALNKRRDKEMARLDVLAPRFFSATDINLMKILESKFDLSRIFSQRHSQGY